MCRCFCNRTKAQEFRSCGAVLVQTFQYRDIASTAQPLEIPCPIFIERLWRSLKYECIYLHVFSDGRQALELVTGSPSTTTGALTAPMAVRRRPGYMRQAVGLRPGLTPGPPSVSLGSVVSRI